MILSRLTQTCAAIRQQPPLYLTHCFLPLAVWRGCLVGLHRFFLLHMALKHDYLAGLGNGVARCGSLACQFGCVTIRAVVNGCLECLFFCYFGRCNIRHHIFRMHHAAP